MLEGTIGELALDQSQYYTLDPIFNRLDMYKTNNTDISANKYLSHKFILQMINIASI